MGKPALQINKYMQERKPDWTIKKVSTFKTLLRMGDLPSYEAQKERFDLFLQFREQGQTENQAIASIFKLEESRETTLLFA